MGKANIWKAQAKIGKQHFLEAVHMKIVFLLFYRLTGKNILFPRVQLRNISPPRHNLFWQAVNS